MSLPIPARALSQSRTLHYEPASCDAKPMHAASARASPEAKHVHSLWPPQSVSEDRTSYQQQRPARGTGGFGFYPARALIRGCFRSLGLPLPSLLAIRSDRARAGRLWPTRQRSHRCPGHWVVYGWVVARRGFPVSGHSSRPGDGEAGDPVWPSTSFKPFNHNRFKKNSLSVCYINSSFQFS